MKPQTFENDYIYIYTHTHTQWFRGTASPLSLKSAQPLNTDNNIPSVFTVTVQAEQIIWYPIITDRYNVPHIMSSHTGICLAGVHTHTHTGCSVHWVLFLLKEYSAIAQTSVPLTWKNPQWSSCKPHFIPQRIVGNVGTGSQPVAFSSKRHMDRNAVKAQADPWRQKSGGEETEWRLPEGSYLSGHILYLAPQRHV